jgi:hypothetical protein
LETELIREQRGGAISMKFSEMSTEELRRMVWVFPEAYNEYLERFVKEQQQQGLIPKSG